MYNCYFRDNKTYPKIVAYARGDVNGDGMPDNIYLTGTKSAESPFIENITLIIQHEINGGFTKVHLKENAGYNPTLFLGDFTGNGVSDILIGINSGGSGGMMYYYIYSFADNNAKLIFDFDLYNDSYEYVVTYKDNYKVEVISKINNEKYIIDISTRDEEYLNEIYYENGKLKSPIEGFVNPISGLYPIDFDGNGIYELLAYQKIAGRYNADALGYVLNTLKWRDDVFTLDNQNIAIFGAHM